MRGVLGRLSLNQPPSSLQRRLRERARRYSRAAYRTGLPCRLLVLPGRGIRPPVQPCQLMRALLSQATNLVQEWCFTETANFPKSINFVQEWC